tara:strand:- start:1396 stop:1653 length:258 start_codon:yes stop_codon:yes gene_type:complete
MANIIGLDKDEDKLKKIARQLGMDTKKKSLDVSATKVKPKKVVKSSKTYTKTPNTKKTYTLQYDKKEKKSEGLLGSISKYLKKGN